MRRRRCTIPAARTHGPRRPQVRQLRNSNGPRETVPGRPEISDNAMVGSEPNTRRSANTTTANNTLTIPSLPTTDGWDGPLTSGLSGRSHREIVKRCKMIALVSLTCHIVRFPFV